MKPKLALVLGGGVSIQEMEDLAEAVDLILVAKMLSPVFSSSGFVDGDRIREYLKTPIGEVNIEQLKIPFAAVATESIMENSIIVLHLKNSEPEVLITPAVDSIDLLAFRRANELIRLCEESCIESLSASASVIRRCNFYEAKKERI